MDIKIKYAIYTFCIILFQSFLKLIGVILTGSLSFLSETVDTLIDILFVSITLYSLYYISVIETENIVFPAYTLEPAGSFPNER